MPIAVCMPIFFIFALIIYRPVQTNRIRMNIGFDAKRITHNATGLGNYSRFAVNILAAHYPGNNYLLYTPSQGKENLRKQVSVTPSVSFRYPASRFLYPKALWRSRGIVTDMKRDGVELFHGLSNELPFGLAKAGIRSVVTIHDLIFLRYPRLYPVIDRQIYTYKFWKACREADKIIAVSETTRRDIVSFFGIDDRKIEVVYQGCDPAFALRAGAAEKERVRQTYGLPERFILSVGSIEERKNLLLAVKALKQVDEEVGLVAVGRPTPYLEQIRAYAGANGLSRRVRFLHGFPFADLPALYQCASVFVYPSFFEGFGIPVLEAVTSEVPVIAATGSCLEEAGGPASLYVNPTDEHELAEKLNAVLRDPALAQQMVVAGKAYGSRFGSERLAADLMRVYTQL